jgi:predicted ATPase/DNA-binding CsgD family transcriptional regulator
VPSHNLPADLDSFVGRERDLGELKRLISSARLLTLTGPGGIGKSRLATTLASQILEESLAGIYVIQLAPITDSSLVIHVVASTLAIRGEPGQPLLETVAARLRQGHLLILLDNCERVLDSTALLAQHLLEACPNLRILATSRQPLNVAGEVLWQVEGLPQDQAVALFVERARQIQHDFGGALVMPALIDVCRRLDGMPLAIELAAAKIKVMPVAEIRAHLDDRFRLLTGSARSDVRHATLKTTLDWSYELLSEVEQGVFRSLSILPGTFDLAAASGICGVDVLPILSRLVEKSLVVAVREEQRAGRYCQLDTMRHYGLDRLDESGEREEMERRLIRHFEESFEVSGAHLPSADQKAWLDRIEHDYQNLRGVLSLALVREPATMLRVASRLVWFWFVRGYWMEGLQWTEAVLRASATSQSERAYLLSGAVRLARYLNRYSEGRRYGEEALRLFEELGDVAGRAEALFEVGWLAMPNQRFDQAEACFQEVLRIGREQRRPALTMRALLGIGQVRWRLGKSLQARRFLEKGESLSESLDDGWMRMMLCDTLGHVLYDAGKLMEARRYFQESHDVAQEIGDRYHAAHTLTNMAYVDLDRGYRAAVPTSLEASLPIFAALGQRLDVSVCLDCFALVATESKDYERALRLFSAAAAIRQSIGAAWSAAHHARVKAAIARCDSALSKARANRSRTEGQSMTIEQAVKSVLAKELPVGVPLSHRERLIAGLIGEGMSSAQIAAQLNIAERTVDSHAEHIRIKLGLHSRAQIAAWAVRALLATPSL